MQRTIVLCLVWLSLCICCTSVVPCQTNAPFVLLVVPESDTTVTSSPVYRLSGSTNPGRTVSINGTSFAVFTSGAFAGLLDLNVGENLFVIQSKDRNGGVFEKRFLIVREKPPRTTRSDTLVIEDDMMLPQTDMWLNAGDMLEVQMKGTPGCRAFFHDNLPMYEVPAGQMGGIGGIYRGMYKVSGEDTLTDQPVRLMLFNASGDSVVRYTGANVSFRTRVFPLVGVTRGTRPSLDFGLGKNRLGGAKLSFIDSGIRLAITGKVGRQYRIDLSENNVAWIDEDQVDIQPPGTFPPFSLTGNFSVYGDSRYDYVALALYDKIPYSTTQDLDPTRIHIDLYGAVSNSNWITQQLSAREIKNVYYTQVGRNHFRVTIELRHREVWGYNVRYVGENLVVRIRRQPDHPRFRGMIIAVDAGHGGSNKGALGSTGALEKDVTLATAFHLKKLLEKEGAQVIMTRTDDRFSFNGARLQRVLDENADLLVSIHANSVGSTSNPLLAKGASTYYKYICYRALSQFILDEVLKTGLSSFGNVGSFNFTLNSPTELPNVLVELAFMSHPEDEMKLLDDDFRRQLAERIVDGITEFLDWSGDDDAE